MKASWLGVMAWTCGVGGVCLGVGFVMAGMSDAGLFSALVGGAVFSLYENRHALARREAPPSKVIRMERYLRRRDERRVSPFDSGMGGAA